MPFDTSRKKIVIIFTLITIIFFSAAFTVSADFNTTMDSILSEEKLSYGSASYSLLVGTGKISDDVTIQEAAVKMAEMFPDSAMEWNTSLTLAAFSQMIMSAYEIDGGLMYRIFPNGRYAVRELKYKKIIQGKAYSTMNLSGERAFRIIGRILDKEEAVDAE